MLKKRLITGAAAIMLAAAVLPSVTAYGAAVETTNETETAAAVSDTAQTEIKKYEPIIDWLHTEKQTDTTAGNKKQTDMQQAAGTGDVPKELLDKIKPELYDDKVSGDITYDGYYTTKDGKRVPVSR